VKRIILALSGALIVGASVAENIEGVDEIICASGEAKICFETGQCYSATPWEIGIPDFVVIDIDEKVVSTTKSSSAYRTTALSRVENTDGSIFLQGVDRGRAFSFVIDEATGRMTVAISRDGFSVTIFGACTGSDI